MKNPAKGPIPNKQIWDGLKEHASSNLEKLVPRGSEVAYFDYPVHSNVGDLLIAKGTQQWMKDFQLTIRATQNIFDSCFPQLSRDTIVLCHGGGNFGDLYRHQEYREKIIKQYANNQIVCLPQTFHFKNKSSLLNSSRLLNEHPNLTLFCRDHRSFEIAEEYFASSTHYLCPDMATFLYPVKKSTTAAKDLQLNTVYLIRQDIEKTDLEVPLNNEDWIGDWNDITRSNRYRMKLLQITSLLLGSIFDSGKIYRWWSDTADAAIRSAICKFSHAERIETSRLHGFILASLMDIPVTLHDNTYGKNSAYYSQWHARDANELQ